MKTNVKPKLIAARNSRTGRPRVQITHAQTCSLIPIGRTTPGGRDERKQWLAAPGIRSTDGMESTPAPYRSPFWLPGSHAQTIYPYLALRKPAPAYRRERVDTPDGDFVDFDWV